MCRAPCSKPAPVDRRATTSASNRCRNGPTWANGWYLSRDFPVLFGIARKGNHAPRRYQVVHKISKSRRPLKIAAFMSRDSRLAQTQRRRLALQKTSQDRYRELGHVVTWLPHAILSLTRIHRFSIRVRG